jgi:small subunit ribosomal protein S8
MTDPIADLIIRIKNAHMAGHAKVSVPYSRFKEAIAQILVTEGYVESFSVHELSVGKNLEIQLKYVGKSPAVTNVKRVSTPGRRLYVSSNQIPRSLGGYGITVVSTSKGVMTDAQARKANVGGEVLFQIW